MTQGVIVEIRAAEGGDDAKALVREQYQLYERRAKFLGLEIEPLEDLPGMVSFRVSGATGWAFDAFKNERGGHRWQRIPPNEKRGRVHTSTVTVAMLRELEEREFPLEPDEVQIETVRGTGPGGQHKNTSDTCVVATHLPTGLTARSQNQRSQDQNRKQALRVLRGRVREHYRGAMLRNRDDDRRSQVGSGMRGDKRRTIRVQDGRVTDHITGQRWELKSYLRGEW